MLAILCFCGSVKTMDGECSDEVKDGIIAVKFDGMLQFKERRGIE